MLNLFGETSASPRSIPLTCVLTEAGSRDQMNIIFLTSHLRTSANWMWYLCEYYMRINFSILSQIELKLSVKHSFLYFLRAFWKWLHCCARCLNVNLLSTWEDRQFDGCNRLSKKKKKIEMHKTLKHVFKSTFRSHWEFEMAEYVVRNDGLTCPVRSKELLLLQKETTVLIALLWKLLDQSLLLFWYNHWQTVWP